MLNGIDPIIIFNFSKANLTSGSQLTSNFIDGIKKNNILAGIVDKIDLPAIPIYLSERLTGIMIDSEDKHVDIETSTETLVISDNPLLNQKGLNNSVKIKMSAVKDSIGLTLLIAMSDLIFPKVTSKEYSITYLHGATTVFAGLLHSFSISQTSENDLYEINIEIIRTGIIPKQLSTVIPNKVVTNIKDVVKP